jgi:hypothetical protein
MPKRGTTAEQPAFIVPLRDLVNASLAQMFGPKEERTRLVSQYETALGLELIATRALLHAEVQQDAGAYTRALEFIREVSDYLGGGQ